MAIYPQQLTIYLYSAHRAVIFAIAQLSCFVSVYHSVYVHYKYVSAIHVVLRVRNVTGSRVT